MTPTGDPYRILGLPPGAPLADVKRAYRRLAKANHPDTAGESAIPRFLAIRAAYELLAGDPRGPGGIARRPGPPWQADPERARATRESWRSRAGRRPGEPRDDAADGTPGGEDRGPMGGTRSRPPGGRARGGATTDASSRRGRRAGSGSNRPPGRATPGSTSYDFADHEPFDPEWSGASWYGQSSGTYWTINPREYADPRKHGPEYQARARRRSDGPLGADADVADVGPPAGDEAESDADAADATPTDRAREAPARETRVAGSTAVSEGPSADSASATATFDPLAAVPLPPGPRSRIALALVAWPPLGLALATLGGELTGCGRFAAGCVEAFAVGTWIAQVALIAVLLALPSVAAVAAVGSLAVLAVSIPAAVFLSAVGGSRDPANAAAVLAFVLGVAWLVGVGIAVARRSRTVPP